MPTTRHDESVASRLAEQRGETPPRRETDPDWAQTYFGPDHRTPSQERAVTKSQHLVDLLLQTPRDHPWYPNRLLRAAASVDRMLEFF